MPCISSQNMKIRKCSEENGTVCEIFVENDVRRKNVNKSMYLVGINSCINKTDNVINVSNVDNEKAKNIQKTIGKAEAS